MVDAIEAAKKEAAHYDYWNCIRSPGPGRAPLEPTDEERDAVARALLDTKLHLDLANKTIAAHLDAAGGQEGGRLAGVTLGEDIVVAVLRHLKARAGKAESQVVEMKDRLDRLLAALKALRAPGASEYGYDLEKSRAAVIQASEAILDVERA
jgi:hypothetical protein